MQRRSFLGLAASLPAAVEAAQQPAGAVSWAPVAFARRDLALLAVPFPMTAVRLSDGPCKAAQEINRKYLYRLPVARLVHNFLVTAGLPSPAEPLGGWEEPKGELRGHFTGHFLSACALSYASSGDIDLKKKGDEIVAQLSKCQSALGDGYLSAYPREFWDRLKNGARVWAPFYTLHKIMAGLLDMHQLGGNQQALSVVEDMAGWVDRWTEPLGEERMQKVLDVEYGGMGEVLYNLWAVTGKARYAEIGHRFDHKHFFDPLALRRDELKGLHVNTHVPQVIGAARRYELTQEPRYRDIAQFFWDEVTGARCYVNGGTSNREQWLTDPGRLAAELRMATTTNECCKVYNMLKLTRHLYQWHADPRYFDYYERTLFNHRLGTIHPETGGTMYYLGLNPGSYKTFSSELGSFWCCTGTGIEEFAKLNDSIYFHDDQGVFVNLFIASELNWPEKNLRLRQATTFPEQAGTSLLLDPAQPTQMTLRIRVPWWAARGGSVRLNGLALDAFAGPGSYLVLSRTWRKGDRVDVDVPMSLYTESMPDDTAMRAVLYGPLVLVGEMGHIDPAAEKIFGLQGQRDKSNQNPMPVLKGDPANPAGWLKPVPQQPLTFRTAGQATDTTLLPLYRVLGQKYTVYWTMRG